GGDGDQARRHKGGGFFFSSRRRHTRSKRDWSSDVCSSDLEVAARSGKDGRTKVLRYTSLQSSQLPDGVRVINHLRQQAPDVDGRSEERRVGKECGIRATTVG